MKQPTAAGRVRIIAGEWRSRLLPVSDLPGLRPTYDRVRETLFNWLGPRLTGAHCLDVCAGTGALGFEALSRGAARCVFVEQNREIAGTLRESARQLGAVDRAEILLDDARHFLTGSPQAFDVIFVDPPFAAGLTEALLQALIPAWLAPGASLYLETARDAPEIPLPEGWRMMRSAQTRQVRFGLVQRVPND
jgi:16S rRNA (guanine966-N2)-methyltransferase